MGKDLVPINTDNSLIPVDQINIVEFFTDNSNVDPMLEEIRSRALSHEPNLDTAKGRKEIASVAAKVAKSKTLLDKLGKGLTADWKTKAKKVDTSRKHIRDYLDSLKAEVRKPLTDWEQAEEDRKERERLERELNEDWDAAIAENDLFDRQREVERKEAELKRHEEERLAKERAKREAKEKKDRDERIAREAAEKARIEAETKAQKEKEEVERREREAIEAAERAECERVEAEKRAEQERLDAIKKAEAEKAAAVKAAEKKAAQEARDREEKRLAEEAAAEAEKKRKAADMEHRADINRSALACFEVNAIDTATAKAVISLIARGKIDYISINY